MDIKIHPLLFLTLLILLPTISVAQEDFSIFAKQKVVVADIVDRNDIPLSDGAKKVIHQSIVDVCTNSDLYEVYEVNVEEIKRQITASGGTANFANICKKIGQKADYIIFTTIKTSRSAIGSQDVNILISATLYRIQTATEVLASQTQAEANSQSLIKQSSQMIAKMLGLPDPSQNKAQVQTKIQNQDQVQTPIQQAITTTTASTNTPNIESSEWLYLKGKEYYDNKSYDKAIIYFLQAVEQNHSDAKFWLGECYYEGKGVNTDRTEAVKWYREAALMGNSKAQYYLGLCYYYGNGVTKNEAEAVKWFRKAAEQRFVVAKEKLKELGYSY